MDAQNVSNDMREEWEGTTERQRHNVLDWKAVCITKRCSIASEKKRKKGGKRKHTEMNVCQGALTRESKSDYPYFCL